MSEIINIVEELINKAKGYTSSGGNSGGVAEAADHSLSTPPKADEAQKEGNPANSGTHPKNQKTPGQGKSAGGGSDFKDGAAEEDEIQGVKGPAGKAPQGRPGTLKHEGGGSGPNHPGTATTTQSQQKSTTSNLEKSEENEEKEEHEESEEEAPSFPKKSDEQGEAPERGEDKEDEKEEKSSESGEVYLDIDEFANEIVSKAVDILREEFAPTFAKSQESEFVEAGLAKSLVSALDRIEELEKAITNVANVMNIRKSLLKSSDMSGIKNPSLEHTQLSKSEISSRLLDLQMKGDSSVDTNTVLRFDAVGDVGLLSAAVRQKIGLD